MAIQEPVDDEIAVLTKNLAKLELEAKIAEVRARTAEASARLHEATAKMFEAQKQQLTARTAITELQNRTGKPYPKM